MAGHLATAEAAGLAAQAELVQEVVEALPDLEQV